MRIIRIIAATLGIIISLGNPIIIMQVDIATYRYAVTRLFLWTVPPFREAILTGLANAICRYEPTFIYARATTCPFITVIVSNSMVQSHIPKP